MDYAAQLLGPSTEKPIPAGTDYAAQVLGASPKAPKATSFDDLPITNKDAGVTDKTVADFTTMVKAAMVDDPGTKLKIFSQARFPKDPKAIDRYGIVDGEVVYVGEDDKLYRETPTGFVGWMSRNVGAPLAASPATAVLGTAGAIAGAPAGGFGGVALGGTGAAVGKLIDKGIAKLAFDEPQTAAGNLKAAATEQVFAGLGGAIGGGLAKWMERHLARDIAKVNPQAAADISRKATDIGLDLNVPQATNLPSLKAKHDVLASLPTSRDIIAADAAKQAGQARNAVDKFIDRVSPRDGLDEAGEVARNAAKGVISMVTKERADAARPLYRAAFEASEGIPPELMGKVTDLSSRPDMARAFRSAERLAKNEGIDLADPKSSLLGMHYAKLALDDMIDGAGAQGMGAVRKRQLVGMKEELLSVMDSMSPDYTQARKVFAHFSPTVNAVKEGVISRLSGLSDESIHRASNMLFRGDISPKSVGKTRELFVKAGLEGDWNTVLSSYLRDTFEQAGKQTMTTPGGAVTQAPKWSAQMVNPRQYRVMEKAMSPDQFQGFKDMMDVFNAMGRTAYAGANSQTMPRAEAAAAMRREVGPGVAGQVAGLASPQNWGARVSSWIAEARMGNHAEKMAQVLTSPDGMNRLRDLKRLSPRDQKFIAGMSNLFGISLAPNAQAESPSPIQSVPQ